MPSHPRGLSAVFVILVAACANPGPGDTTPAAAASTPPSIARTGTGANIHLGSDNETVTLDVKASPVDAWNALVTVLEEAKIPLTERDLHSGIVGNPRFVARGRLLGQPMSRFLDCGQGPTGTYANNARIEMSIRGSVLSAGAGKVRLGILVNAIARNMEGNSNTRMQCSSYNRLEQELLERVQQRLATS